MRGTVEHAFAEARESVSWADEAIAEFRAGLDAFFRKSAGLVVTEYDSAAGEFARKLKLQQPISRSLRRKATEALTTLKHSFDQATFAARNLTSGRRSGSIYFPWANSPTDLERLLENRGLDRRLWDVFASHQPYPTSTAYEGGDDLARALAKLANQKHTLGLIIDAHIYSARMPDISGRGIVGLRVAMPRWDPVKNEAILVRWVKGDLEFRDHYEFQFQMFFKNAGLPAPLDAPSALAAFSTKAKAVITTLEQRCRELCD